MSEERVNRLEERLAWLQRHVTEQDKVMLDMSRQLDRVVAELRLLRDRVASGGGGAQDAPTDERPPHY